MQQKVAFMQPRNLSVFAWPTLLYNFPNIYHAFFQSMLRRVKSKMFGENLSPKLSPPFSSLGVLPFGLCYIEFKTQADQTRRVSAFVA